MINKLENAQRRNQRKELFYSFEVLDENSQSIGHISDLTLAGMKVFGQNPVEQYKIQQLKLKLPERISEKQEIKFEAECMWCSKAADGYNIGFRTDYKNSDNIKIIKIIMELLASPNELII